VEYGDGFAAEPGYVTTGTQSPYDRRGNPIAPPIFGSLDEILIRPALKLLIKDRESDVDVFLGGALEHSVTVLVLIPTRRRSLVGHRRARGHQATGLADVVAHVSAMAATSSRR